MLTRITSDRIKILVLSFFGGHMTLAGITRVCIRGKKKLFSQIKIYTVKFIFSLIVT